MSNTDNIGRWNTTAIQGCVSCPKMRSTPNGTNLGHFKISFSTFWLAEICLICGRSDLQSDAKSHINTNHRQKCFWSLKSQITKSEKKKFFKTKLQSGWNYAASNKNKSEKETIQMVSSWNLNLGLNFRTWRVRWTAQRQWLGDLI